VRANKSAPLPSVKVKNTQSNKKTIDTNTLILPLSKARSWLDFLNNDALLLQPDKDMFRKRLALTLLEWADQETSLEIAEFAFEMKIARSTLYEWSEKYPEFKRIYDYAKLMIGTRRRKGALLRKFDKDVVHRDEHVYDPERHEINVYHNNLKKDIQNDNTTKVIVLSQLDTGEFVPITKKDNE
jgi:hypothetical protein